MKTEKLFLPYTMRQFEFYICCFFLGGGYSISQTAHRRPYTEETYVDDLICS